MAKMTLKYLLIVGFVFLTCVTLCTSAENGENTDKNGENGADPKPPVSPQNKTSTKPITGDSNSTNCTGPDCPNKVGYPTLLYNKITENKGMLVRTFYVLIGVTVVLVLYFVIKTMRSRSRKNRAKKYGVLSTSESDLEMRPLEEGDEDDEDTTVFDINGIK